MFDSAFWVTLAINAVLTLVLGVLATVIAPALAAKAVDFFYSRRVKRTLKQKQYELRNYNLTKAFHEGRKDKQFYYVYLGTLITSSFVVSATFTVALIELDIDVFSGLDLTSALLLVGGLLSALIAAVLLVSMRYTATNLENFEEYEKRVKERWPDA